MEEEEEAEAMCTGYSSEGVGMKVARRRLLRLRIVEGVVEAL